MSGRYNPYKLEYSAKDDKFRLITTGGRYAADINLARITECELLDPYGEHIIPPQRKECALSLTLRDERNALERVTLHFSGCRKETRRLTDDTYQMTLWYDAQDETEMLIRVLSFGPLVKATAPPEFFDLIRERLRRQMEFSDLGTFFP